MKHLIALTAVRPSFAASVACLLAAAQGSTAARAQNAPSAQPSDMTAPTITVDTPRNGVTYAQAQLSGALMQGRARDNAGGSGVAGAAVLFSREVSGVTRYYDGRAFSLAAPKYLTVAITGSGDLKTWSLRLPTAAAGLIPGVYRVRALARDRKGNSGYSALATFSARAPVVPGDRTPPKVTIDTPVNGGSYPAATEYFGAEGSARDNAGGGGIASVRVIAYRYADANGPAGYFNGRDFSSPTPIENSVLSEPATTSSNQLSSWLFAFPSVHTAGRILVRAIARDKAGNSATASITFTRR